MQSATRLCVWFLVIVMFADGIFGQVASLCRPNERLLTCGGCQKTCDDPIPDCKGVCRVGCYCPPGEVRNATGHCVNLSECPPIKDILKLDTTEPREDGGCSENEEYRYCEPCNRTCDNPNPICPAQCARGCFCKPGLVRRQDRRCVKYEDCFATTSITSSTTPQPQITCAPRQVHKLCENCEKTCSNPNPHCPAQCRRGCFCKEGYVKSPSGDCIKLEDCPKAPPTGLTMTPSPNMNLVTCGTLQVYKDCENCEKTCANPNPQCPAQCKKGCFCIEGYFKSPNGDCVKQENCPNATAIVPVMTTVPIINLINCGPRQVYKHCENCEKTCSNPNPLCPAQCRKGCFCKEGYFKSPNGDCVKIENCPKVTTTHPIAYQLICGSRQIFKDCENCEKTCSNPNPRCPAECRRGCFCIDGYFKSPNGDCVKLEYCPRAEVSVAAEDTSIDDCDTDEEYFSCGWCEPTCSEPNPACPQKVCTRGCLCKPPLVRHRSGHCVEQKNCMPRNDKCLDPNEEYVCRYGCEPRCDMKGKRMCRKRPRKCSLGCHCKLGLIRDRNGHCVTPDKCSI